MAESPSLGQTRDMLIDTKLEILERPTYSFWHLTTIVSFHSPVERAI